MAFQLSIQRSAPLCTQRPAAPTRVALLRASTASAPTQVATQKGQVHPLSSDEFHDFLASSEMVLVDYYTDWCGPCKMIAPHLEEMAAEMPHVKFAKLNCTTDTAAKKIAMAQGIKALPTFHFFRNNERVGVFVGGKPNALRKFLAELLS